MEIRPVRPGECARLGQLTVAAYGALEGSTLSGGYAAELADVSARAAQAVVLAAVDGTRLLGGVTYVPDAANPYAEDLREDEAGIRMLAVAPSAQGRGIGRALVEACIERAVRDGRRALALHSTPWMAAAHHLYLSLGFRRDTERDCRPVPEVQLLGFVLELDRTERRVPSDGPASASRGHPFA